VLLVGEGADFVLQLVVVVWRPCWFGTESVVVPRLASALTAEKARSFRDLVFTSWAQKRQLKNASWYTPSTL
jgi:hypothetical protein